jgi:type IV pilus assembly protein PilA
MDQWFYLEADGSQRGPLSLDQLLTALRSRPPQTQVWRSGLAQWVAANSLPELRAAWAAPLAPPAPVAPPPLGAPPAQVAPRVTASRAASEEENPWTGPSARGGGMAPEEEPSLNPLIVFKRSFFPQGRFGRGEFAIAYFAPSVAAFALCLFGFLLAALLGGGGNKKAGGAALAVMIITMGPAALLLFVGIYTNFVASIRRLRDRGNSPWMALLLFLPCANIVLLGYLLFAPTREAEAQQLMATATGFPVAVLLIALGVGCVPAVGIVAAIAIPSLLRARVSANEAAAIGDIRTVISAEAAYQSANNGYYDTMQCLATPATCIPDYTGPTFIDPALASATLKSGYKRTFHAGPVPARRPSGTSPSSMETWAYVAVPATQGQTGVRAFCGDSSGVIRVTLDGREPGVADGNCDQSTPPLP